MKLFMFFIAALVTVLLAKAIVFNVPATAKVL